VCVAEKESIPEIPARNIVKFCCSCYLPEVNEVFGILPLNPGHLQTKHTQILGFQGRDY
jgi:hypothetical protein